ncbi:GNAT family N-acetyltransferase [Deinococcus sp. Leaf326]|uniref:GNAT family N-acetyltransferase n=1 Tax=Deinococcus sp. Leaf326 TaxID=1736338 RepID=UPI0006FA73EF|nr:GNAT family N-acetyltransferase [Deinococcus sp. Leaf326]KQR22795.1 GCN5 family acetyltransferase [Deinococcus sp. Leaf326]
MSAQVLYRSAEPRDERLLGEIAHATGYFGDPATCFFPDLQLFADLWVRPYLHGGGGASFVVELGGEVQGYILGAPDPDAYRRAVVQTVQQRVLPRLLAGQYRRPWPGLLYLLRAAVFGGPHADPETFPAHLHLNLLPIARGRGLSGPLLELHLARLAELGARGVQLSTTLENAAALRTYQRCGFVISGARRTPLWTPWLGRPAVHVVMTRPVT